MNTVTVKAYTRQKPQKPEVYISKHEQLRAEVAAMARVNEFRDSIGYETGSRPIEIVMACARGLKSLALTGRM
jgi:hypothetical protein